MLSFSHVRKCLRKQIFSAVQQQKKRKSSNFSPLHHQALQQNMSQEFTVESLAPFNGANDCPIYVSLKCVVYDVSKGKDFYAPGKPYAFFAGKEVSRCLGKMEMDENEANAGWRNLNAEHMQTLDEWVTKYEAKYPVIGTFKTDPHFEIRGMELAP